MRTSFKYKALGLLILASVMAGKAHNAVKLTQTNAESVVLLLSDHPKIRLEGTKVNIVTDKEHFSYEFSDISKFEFIDYELNSITGIYGESFAMKWNNNIMEGHNLKPNSPVIIADLSGRIYSSVKTDNMGSFSINLIDLPTGVYLFSTSGHNFKFHKK